MSAGIMGNMLTLLKIIKSGFPSDLDLKNKPKTFTAKLIMETKRKGDFAVCFSVGIQ